MKNRCFYCARVVDIDDEGNLQSHSVDYITIECEGSGKRGVSIEG